MPPLLRRLTFAFAALAVGVVVSLWIAVRVVAGRVVDEKTEPVKRQLLADWERQEARFVQDLQATERWASGGGVTPPATGCALRWQPEGHDAVKAHTERCGAPAVPLDAATVATLGELGDAALAREAELPASSLELGWMTALREHGDWRDARGTPFELVDVAPTASVLDLPLLDAGHARHLATLRLVAGQRAGGLEDAVEDVTAFARALLGRPTLPEQLVGLAVLQQLRRQLDAAGRRDVGPAADFVEALGRTRLAASQLWHPWLPAARREALLPRLPDASRCAAAAEALLFAELGAPFAQNYTGHLAALHAWRGPACTSDFVQRAHDARREVPPETWRRLLGQAGLLSGDGSSALGPAVVARLVDVDPAAQRAAVEVVLALITPRPFPEDAP